MMFRCSGTPFSTAQMGATSVPFLQGNRAEVVVRDCLPFEEAENLRLVEAEHWTVDHGVRLYDRDLVRREGLHDLVGRTQRPWLGALCEGHFVDLPERGVPLVTGDDIDDVLLVGGTVGHDPNRCHLVAGCQLERPEVEVLDGLAVIEAGHRCLSLGETDDRGTAAVFRHGRFR